MDASTVMVAATVFSTMFDSDFFKIYPFFDYDIIIS